MWDFLQANWHKILVVILAGASAWKYFFEYVRPTIKVTNTQPINIVLPKEGMVITIKPLDKHHSDGEDS